MATYKSLTSTQLTGPVGPVRWKIRFFFLIFRCQILNANVHFLNGSSFRGTFNAITQQRALPMLSLALVVIFFRFPCFFGLADKYTMADMRFRWRDDPLSFPSDFGDGFRLPRYVVSFVTDNRLNVIYYGDGKSKTYL